MNDKAATIRKNYNQMVKSCKLDTWEIWGIQEEIRDILFEKGYDLVNFSNAPCRYGMFNCIDCYSNVAEKLTQEIKKQGYAVYLVKNQDRPSISWIIFPFNMVHEIRNVVEEFEVNK